uniref:Uncharacterized protein n=1 Tax=Timema genevievae TaxID=629358 RepID=A0A7R9PTA9_TIMGE|nr:unnamed protein product [Timema genevievae]
MEASSHFSESEGNEKRHEVLIKDEIKIEPEMDLEPPEYISVAVKSEIPDSFEPESSCVPLPVKQVSEVKISLMVFGRFPMRPIHAPVPLLLDRYWPASVV